MSETEASGNSVDLDIRAFKQVDRLPHTHGAQELPRALPGGLAKGTEEMCTAQTREFGQIT